jgi:hypothetical protein
VNATNVHAAPSTPAEEVNAVGVGLHTRTSIAPFA